MPLLPAFITMPQSTELIVIFVVVLLIFGPKQLPKLARSIGQSMREFRDATNKVTQSIQDMDEEPAKPRLESVSKASDQSPSPGNS